MWEMKNVISKAKAKESSGYVYILDHDNRSFIYCQVMTPGHERPLKTI